MKLNYVKATIVTFLVLSFLAVGTVNVSAQEEIDCTGRGEPKLDLLCQRKKILQPDYECQLLYCSEDGPPTSGGGEGDIVETNFFGVKIRVNSDRALASFIYLGFSLFLALVAMAAVFLGVLAAYKRSRVTEKADIEAAQKIATNAVIGFVIVGISLIFVQLLAAFLGIGNVFDMVDLSGVLGSDSAPSN